MKNTKVINGWKSLQTSFFHWVEKRSFVNIFKHMQVRQNDEIVWRFPVTECLMAPLGVNIKYYSSMSNLAAEVPCLWPPKWYIISWSTGCSGSMSSDEWVTLVSLLLWLLIWWCIVHFHSLFDALDHPPHIVEWLCHNRTLFCVCCILHGLL